ncbi:MAG: S41 family peptidase [Planctomycetota bacterium]
MLSKRLGSFVLAGRENYRICLSWLLIGYFLLISPCLSAQFAGHKNSQLDSVLVTEPSYLVKQICSKIYEGDFPAAKSLIDENKSDKNPAIAQLRGIVSQYEQVDRWRNLQQQEAYQEKLKELSEVEIAADVNQVDDTNDISNALSIITRACEFATERQKEEFLKKPFVKQILETAKAKANEFESEGKWLDACLVYYSWLKEIHKESEYYSDYVEKLLTKATIVSSFQDSPCETSWERYSGIKKEMFIKAVGTLKLNYVRLPDYRRMALKAIERCQLLAEVLKVSFSRIKENQKDLAEKDRFDLSEPDTNSLVVWLAKLTDKLDEMSRSITDIDKNKFLEIFEEIIKLNDETVKLPENVLIAHFSEAAFLGLDSYTMMIWPQQVQEFQKDLTKEFTGIGIEISKRDGLLTATSLLPDTPAYHSGLDAGDVIEAVDGVPTKDMSLLCAVRNITGPAGTDVRLTIRRPGENKTRDITITRAKIIVPSVRGWQRTENGKWFYMIDDKNKVGYVRVTSFLEKTASDLEAVLTELEKDGLKGLVLDLRFNPGGLLSSSVDMVDKFIEKGRVVATRPRFGIPAVNFAKKTGTHPDYPLVVLINSYSASASEILAGALQDPRHNRAVIVGERSHGKGSVQTITPDLGGGSRLKYTMAYYYLPSGQRVESEEETQRQGRDDWGIGPNVKVELKSNEFKKRADVQKENEVLFKLGHDNGSVPINRHTVEETLSSDPQLAVAVLIVKTKLIERGLAGN